MRVGITGGIGSGKTTVCRIFETLGVPVYYADAEAKRLYIENIALKNLLLDTYGPQVMNNGAINKAFLRSVAFGSAEEAEKLNRLVHPFVFEHYEKWCLEHKDRAYTLKEAAILFESGSYKRVHKAIGVLAPEELRIQRVINRDQSTREDVLKRIKKQWPQEKIETLCHYTIHNDETHSLIEQVRSLHTQLLKDSLQEWPYMA
jgi:dephospho-CoA kinase